MIIYMETLFNEMKRMFAENDLKGIGGLLMVHRKIVKKSESKRKLEGEIERLKEQNQNLMQL